MYAIIKSIRDPMSAWLGNHLHDCSEISMHFKCWNCTKSDKWEM